MWHHTERNKSGSRCSSVKLWLCNSSSVQRPRCAGSLSGNPQASLCVQGVYSPSGVLTCSTSSVFITHCCTSEAEGQILLLIFFYLVFVFCFFGCFSAACISASVRFLVFPALRWLFTSLFFDLFYFFIPGCAPACSLVFLSFFCLSHSFCILYLCWVFFDFVLF